VILDAIPIYLDSIPIHLGRRANLIWTVFQELFGRFSGTVGTVSKMGRNDPVGVKWRVDLSLLAPFCKWVQWHEKIYLCVTLKTYFD
jgi:hypothetical protein